MKNIKSFIFIVSSTFVMALGIPAFAITSDSIRCAGGLVSVGDVASDLVGKCGNPTFATQRAERIVDEPGPYERVIAIDVIDDWTFNFGPDRLQYRVLLKNGRIWQIESLYYGY